MGDVPEQKKFLAAVTTHPVGCRGGAGCVVWKEKSYFTKLSERVRNQRIRWSIMELTYGGSDSQCDAVPALLDQVDDVAVVEGVDVHVVHC